MTDNKYALVSVSDKTGIVEFAKEIIELGYKIISTGNTAKVLSQNNIKTIPVQDITGNPESFDGRMKTISFQVEGGILFDREKSTHVKDAKKFGIKNIDIVVCNFYPFEKVVSNSKTKLIDAVESIDIGGPTMTRAAAKNFKHVLIVIDPKDYGLVGKALREKVVNEKLRRTLAAKAFSHLSFYDAQVGKFLKDDEFSEEIVIPGRRKTVLRYGENPHQKAAVYLEPNTNSPLKNLEKITGRDISYVNFTDIFAGLESIRVFSEPAAVVIKHNTPCGIALGKDLGQALKRAIEADSESAFGGIIVVNKEIDLKIAKMFASFKEKHGILVDLVAAPSVTSSAREYITKIRKSTGIYVFGKIPKKRSNNQHIRFFDGGFVIQDWDDYAEENFPNWKVATKIKPTKKQMQQMKIAWKFIGRIKSNSIIIIDKDLPMTRGIGSGQTSRVKSVKIALEQAGKLTKGAILASDSFFPFNDCVKLAAKHGIAAIVQQGGSVRDEDSIKEADKAKIPMVFTNQRAFWH